MSNDRTELNQLGEFGLIDHISNKFQNNHSSTIKGIGDDTAVIDSGDKYTLVTTDMLLEGVHFDLSYMPIAHLGYKAVAVNISDIAAMNGTPKQITVSIALSNRFSLQAIDALYDGIKSACEAYNVDLVGGDTNSSSSGLTLSITAIGEVEKKDLVMRSGAGENDILCVTGDLGGAYFGLQVLEREKQVFLTNPEMQPNLDSYNYIVGRQLKPEARMDVIHELRDLEVIPTSMIDISDGLASEIFHLSKNTKLGFRIFEDKLPIDKQTFDTAYEFKIDPTTAALNGGEDYELLFTIKQEDLEKIKNHPDIHMIGHSHKLEAGNTLVTKKENIVPLTAQGWNHLSSEER